MSKKYASINMSYSGLKSEKKCNLVLAGKPHYLPERLKSMFCKFFSKGVTPSPKESGPAARTSRE